MTPYSKKRSPLEKELSCFLAQTTSRRDITTAYPGDAVSFLIWKDRRRKTVVHDKNCVYDAELLEQWTLSSEKLDLFSASVAEFSTISCSRATVTLQRLGK